MKLNLTLALNTECYYEGECFVSDFDFILSPSDEVLKHWTSIVKHWVLKYFNCHGFHTFYKHCCFIVLIFISNCFKKLKFGTNISAVRKLIQCSWILYSIILFCISIVFIVFSITFSLVYIFDFHWFFWYILYLIIKLIVLKQMITTIFVFNASCNIYNYHI